MIIPVPLIVRGRILRAFRDVGAVGQSNAKTLAELDMERSPFTLFGYKRMFAALQKRGIVQNDGEKFYLSK